MRYSAKEIAGLIRGYYELREAKGVSGYGLYILCVLADLERALEKMPSKEYQTVLVHGLLRVPSREAGQVLGVSHMTIQNRLEAGIAWIVAYLNEGVE